MAGAVQSAIARQKYFDFVPKFGEGLWQRSKNIAQSASADKRRRLGSNFEYAESGHQFYRLDRAPLEGGIYFDSAQKGGSFLGCGRIDIESGPPLKTGHFRDFRNHLDMPVEILVALQ